MAENPFVSANDNDDARTLLKRAPALQDRCDLDLLVFFARHWRALLSSAQLARLLGYSLKEIIRSRDVLVAAGWLTRAENPTRAEQMYVLNRECMDGGPLPAIVALASTPRGRLSLRLELPSSPAGGQNDVPEQARQGNALDERLPRDGGSRKRSRSRERRSNEPPERTQ
jgi:hypothetical protein